MVSHFPGTTEQQTSGDFRQTVIVIMLYFILYDIILFYFLTSITLNEIIHLIIIRYVRKLVIMSQNNKQGLKSPTNRSVILSHPLLDMEHQPAGCLGVTGLLL